MRAGEERRGGEGAAAGPGRPGLPSGPSRGPRRRGPGRRRTKERLAGSPGEGGPGGGRRCGRARPGQAGGRRLGPPSPGWQPAACGERGRRLGPRRLPEEESSLRLGPRQGLRTGSPPRWSGGGRRGPSPPSWRSRWRNVDLSVTVAQWRRSCAEGKAYFSLFTR